MPSKAPYHHADGSNCWTKNCSRGHKKTSVVAGKPENTFTGLYANDDAYMTRQLQLLQEQFRPRIEKVSFNKVQPLNITSAGFLKESFATTLKTEYNQNIISPVYETDYCMEKPAGGLWAAPVDENGSDAWTTFYEPIGKRYEVKLDPGATVAVIDKVEDYVALLQRFKHDEKSFEATRRHESYRSTTGGSVWRSETERLDSLNYEKLGQIVDAVYVTQKGLAECGVWSSNSLDNRLPDNVATLSTWDIPSLLIFNHNKISKVTESPAPDPEYYR